MASFIFDKSSFLATGDSARVLKQEGGKLRAIIASTSNAAVQTITIYDSKTTSGDVLLKVNVDDSHPVAIFFPLQTLPDFNQGLAVDPSNCDVLIAYS